MNRPNYAKCLKNHDGNLAETNISYGCGKGGHRLKSSPTFTAKGEKENKLLEVVQTLISKSKTAFVPFDPKITKRPPRIW